MPEGRVKKAKKPRWQVVLGLKQVLCGALGLTWVMVIIFILGVLAGRGDIYRWLSSWGLITPVSSNVAQWSPPAEAPLAAAAAKSPPGAPAAPPPASSTSAAPPTPVTGSMAPTPAPAPASSPAKKAKKGVSLRDQKDQELLKLRREMAGKLKFQNSFDSHPAKPARTAQKQKEKAAASKTVRVAQYRDLKAAKAKVAELQKKGEKVALKQGKDNKGVFYDIVREAPATPQPADALAQKTQKSSGNKPKKPAGAGN